MVITICFLLPDIFFQQSNPLLLDEAARSFVIKESEEVVAEFLEK